MQHTAKGIFTLKDPDGALACIEILDKFLAGIVTFIFGTGIFELFISRLDDAWSSAKNNPSESARHVERPTWLHIHGIDDMEMQPGKVVITILVVNLMAAVKVTVSSLLCTLLQLCFLLLGP